MDRPIDQPFRRYAPRFSPFVALMWTACGWPLLTDVCKSEDSKAVPAPVGNPLAAASTSELVFERPEILSPIELHGGDARWQLQVSRVDRLPVARGMQNVRVVDVTRSVILTVDPPIAEIDAQGYLRPIANGEATVTARDSSNLEARLAIHLTGMESMQPVNFPNQIIPIFTKLGCNGGGCHGKASGQAGFKLSLLGFEPAEDFDHLVNESRGRRLFPAVPGQSLLLQKAINASPHGGGQRLNVDSHEYRLLERWIATGMPYGNPDDPRVERIEVIPAQRRIERGDSQQLSVVAHYSDGHMEDITHTAQYESNNGDLAEVDAHGFVQIGEQSGDVSVMARYQGNVTVFRASIPLGVDISEVAQWPESANLVDDWVFAKLQTLGIPPSDLCDDSTFIRRVTLDLTGRLPTIEETEQFLAESAASKYADTVDRLLESGEHADYFARKWIAILRNQRQSAGHQFGSFAFHDWLRSSFYENKPYDQLVRELLTASGSVAANPPVVWFRQVADTESRVEDAAQLFLGQRLQCARCHHHPFEKWSQKDYFQMAAFFSTVSRKEGELPEEPIFVSRIGTASSQHPNSGETLKPAGLDDQPLDIPADEDPRGRLVDWMVAPDNPFFARSLVNRYWKHFFATGMVEPEDDMRVTNPPSNPELLDAMSEYFVEHEYDLRELLRLICTSKTYRLSSQANRHNLDDNNSYSRFYPKRLQAEVLLDAIDQVAMTTSKFSGMPDGTRSVSLPDTGFSSYFLDVFGEPESATACECERSGEATLAQSLHLLNSKEVQTKLTSPEGLAAAFATSSDSEGALIDQLYLTALSRHATDSEINAGTDYLNRSTREKRREAFEDLVWAVINTKEFLFNH